MKIVDAILELYSILPLDATLRRGKLPGIISKYPKESAILYILGQELPPVPKKYSPRELNDEDVIKYLLGKLSVAPTECYVVLKAFAQKRYDESVFLTYVPKLYSKENARRILFNLGETTEGEINYVVSSSPLYFVYRGKGSRAHSNVWDKNSRLIVEKNSCVVYTGNGLIATGGKSLYHYMVRKGELPADVYWADVKTCKRSDKAKVVEGNRGKVITFFDNMIDERNTELYQKELQPVDWWLNDNYEVKGFIIDFRGQTFKVKHRKRPKCDLEDVICLCEYAYYNNKVTKFSVLGVWCKEEQSE